MTADASTQPVPIPSPEGAPPPPPSAPPATPPIKPPHPFWAFFGKPIPVAIVSMAGVLSLVLPFVQPRQHRELSYQVSQTRTVIVKTGELSTLSVAVEGKPINTDLTVANVAIWNAGSESIRAAQLLEPLVVRTNPPVPIIAVSTRQPTRDVVRAETVKVEGRANEVNVSWNILEQGDGFVVQVVYAGGAEVNLIASTTVEGQREIKRVEAYPIQTTKPSYGVGQRIFAVGFSVVMVLMFGVMTRNNWKVGVGLRIFTVLLDCAILGLMVFIVQRAFYPPIPPFPF